MSRNPVRYASRMIVPQSGVGSGFIAPPGLVALCRKMNAATQSGDVAVSPGNLCDVLTAPRHCRRRA
jgi:hypothetical protein